MIAILVAKWVADACEKEGVYDLAQTVQGHPFLDLDHSIAIAQKTGDSVEALLPPPQTMEEITVELLNSCLVDRYVLTEKLRLLKRRGLMDGGLVLVSHGHLKGYLSQAELDFGLNEVSAIISTEPDSKIRLLPPSEEQQPGVESLFRYPDLSNFVDRSPIFISAAAPVEYAVEMFGKLGLRYLCVVEAGGGRLVGVRLSYSLNLGVQSSK